jgi:hypothetical protein
MRVLFLDHTAALGGGEIALFNLVTHFDRARITPIVTVFSDGPLVGRLHGAGIETHVLPLSERVGGFRKDNLGAAGWDGIKAGFLCYCVHLAAGGFYSTAAGAAGAYQFAEV